MIPLPNIPLPIENDCRVGGRAALRVSDFEFPYSVCSNASITSAIDDQR